MEIEDNKEHYFNNKQFFSRMRQLYAAWKDALTTCDNGFSKMDCLICAVGGDVIVCNMARALEKWLLGCEFVNLIMIMAEKSIHILSNKNANKYFKLTKNQKTEITGVPPVTFLVRRDDQKDFEKLFQVIRQSKNGKTLGVLHKESYSCDFTIAWEAALREQSFDIVDVSDVVYHLVLSGEKNKIIPKRINTLVLSQNKYIPELENLYIRPYIGPKHIIGTLKAHPNGFQYISIYGHEVNILYDNIKNCFIQQRTFEIIIHFNLQETILLGKNEYADVQFYTEFGDISSDNFKHQYMYDHDDNHSAEQSKKELKKKIKSAYQNFYKTVEEMTARDIVFHRPLKELGFLGTPNSYGSIMFLQTNDNCLICLTEWPPFIVTLDDVAFVTFHIMEDRTFNMIFIYNDYERRNVTRIKNIAENMLEKLKMWVTHHFVDYADTVWSLNWAEIMKAVVNDPELLLGLEGGWTHVVQLYGQKANTDYEYKSEDSDEI